MTRSEVISNLKHLRLESQENLKSWLKRGERGLEDEPFVTKGLEKEILSLTEAIKYLS